jgi:sugar lactone lactonase YvrE
MLKYLRSSFLSVAACSFLSLFALPAQAQVPVSVLSQINRIMGSATGAAGYSGDTGPALSALLSQPEGVAIDGGGNLYIADTANDCIRRIDASTGIVTTVAGIAGQQGYAGDNGPGIAAQLNQPAAVVVDVHGNLYIADTGNQIVRLLNLGTGTIKTVVGTAYTTPFNPAVLGDGGLALSAELDAPAGLALDAAGNLYIADSGDNRIREVTQGTQFITTIAGNGSATYNGDGIAATLASLSQPTSVAVDAAGNIYIADSSHSLIREVVAGNIQIVAGIAGFPGYTGDGHALSQQINFPTGLAVDPSGQIYFSDRASNLIREVNSAGNLVTLAGKFSAGAGLAGDGQLASAALVNQPGGTALGPGGALYIADSGNNQLRLISNGLGFPATSIATTTPVLHDIFLGVNSNTKLNDLVASVGENAQQEFTASTGSGCAFDGVTVNVAGAVCKVPVTFNPGYPGQRTATLQMTAGSIPGIQISFGLYGIGIGPESVILPGVIGTIMDASDATNGIGLNVPGQAATDAAGNLYLADPGSNVVWMLNMVTGNPTIIAGGGNLAPAQADGGPAVDALLNAPTAVALDAAGNLYIAETNTSRIRKVNLATGVITTFAGTGNAGTSGDNGAATAAELSAPTGIASDATGDVFIADSGNNRIRRIDGTTGLITAFAGTGTNGSSGNQGYATLAELADPQGIALDDAGRLYIADTGNNMVRMVDPITGVITSVAGNGTPGFSGDTGVAISAKLSTPSAVAVDSAGDLYIADTVNNRVRKVYASTGIIETIAGSAILGNSGDGGPATDASLDQPAGVALDSLGQIIIPDRGNDTVRMVSTEPADLNFGAEPVGSATSPMTEFLSNIGNQSLMITNFTAPTDFPMAQDSDQCAASSLVPGSLCDLSFVFQPTISGPIAEDGIVTDNDLNTPGMQQDVPLSGNGTVVPVIPTVTTVAVNPATAVYGTPIMLTTTVTGGNGPVSGVVSFSINGIEQASAQLTGSGTATVTLGAAPTGSDIVTANFAAQNGFGASGSAPASLTVTPAPSQITLMASPHQIALGQNVIFTVNVYSTTTGVPTGLVEFFNGTAEIGESTLDPTGQAILNTQFLPPGTDSITAEYLGDGNFQQSTSASTNVTVINDTLTMTANPTQLIIAPGKTGQTTVTLTPKNGFAGVVTLSCAGLVQGATCQFSTPTITFSAQTQTAQTATLTITPSSVAGAGFGVPPGMRGFPRLVLLLLSLGAALLLIRARKQSSAWLDMGRALLIVFCLGVCTLTGCSNLVPQQPIQASITVQASMPSTGIIATAPLQVYMQQ